jgi:hypothetical protein
MPLRLLSEGALCAVLANRISISIFVSSTEKSNRADFVLASHPKRFVRTSERKTNTDEALYASNPT